MATADMPKTPHNCSYDETERHWNLQEWQTQQSQEISFLKAQYAIKDLDKTSFSRTRTIIVELKHGVYYFFNNIILFLFSCQMI